MPVSRLDGYPARKVPSSLTPERLLALAQGHAFQHKFYVKKNPIHISKKKKKGKRHGNWRN